MSDFWFSTGKDLAIPAMCAFMAKKRHHEIKEDMTYNEFLIEYKDHICSKEDDTAVNNKNN